MTHLKQLQAAPWMPWHSWSHEDMQYDHWITWKESPHQNSLPTDRDVRWWQDNSAACQKTNIHDDDDDDDNHACQPSTKMTCVNMVFECWLLNKNYKLIHIIQRNLSRTMWVQRRPTADGNNCNTRERTPEVLPSNGRATGVSVYMK